MGYRPTAAAIERFWPDLTPLPDEVVGKRRPEEGTAETSVWLTERKPVVHWATVFVDASGSNGIGIVFSNSRLAVQFDAGLNSAEQEIAAVLAGLMAAETRRLTRVTVKTDCLAALQQLAFAKAGRPRGVLPCRVIAYGKRFEAARVQWVRRRKNKEADRLASLATRV